MRITAVIFLNAVPDLVTGSSAPSFSADPNTRYGGYELATSSDGIVCRHAKAPGRARCVPWQNVRYTDAEDAPRGTDKRTKAYRESLPTKPEA